MFALLIFSLSYDDKMSYNVGNSVDVGFKVVSLLLLTARVLSAPNMYFCIRGVCQRKRLREPSS